MNHSFHIVSASVTDRGLSQKRPQNEDAFLEMPQCGIFAVADGVGGAQAGEVASQMAMEILGEAFVNVDKGSDAESVMRSALVRANSAINQMSQELPQLAQMATTVVALHINGGIATIGHAGDSRLYRLDSHGMLHRETADHSVVAEEVRAGRMTEQQAENHPGKNIISRALGAEPTIDIETKTIMVSESTTFLICSDGVTRHISDDEIRQLLGTGLRAEEICDRIKSVCYGRGAEDNLTAVIVQMAEDRHSEIPITVDRQQDADEVTVASARTVGIERASEDDDFDDLLEIETGDLGKEPRKEEELDLFYEEPANGQPVSELHTAPLETQESPAQTSPLTAPVNTGALGSTIEFSDEASSTSAIEPRDEAASAGQGEEPAAMSQNVESEPQPDAVVSPSLGEIYQPQTSNYIESEPETSSFAGKVLSSAGLLLLGSVIGLAAYHFFLADRQQPQPAQPTITEVKGASQPQTAFEENRRTLDKNPEAALARYETEPKDAENRFLVGRANLLLGRYPEARKAFLEARELIASGQVDPDNARTIQTEIAIALAVTNDTLIQNILKKELDEVRGSSNATVNAPNR